MNNPTLIYFSPTGTTKKVLEGIAAGLGADAPEHVNLTLPSSRSPEIEVMHGLTVIGVPVYAGRVPREAVRRLGTIRTDRAPAVLVVVYGNRVYEDALLELRDLTVERGFLPVAGGAFIGEHSFATETVPIANGRPDIADLAGARKFGQLVREKIMGSPSPEALASVPGNFPYKQGSALSNISPLTLEDSCILCGTCASVCPVGAITVDDAVSTDRAACIRCCACVKNCPTGARMMDDPTIKKLSEWLNANCRERKEPEFFL